MSFVSDILDDVVGLDPSGGGLWDAGRQVINTVDPIAWAYNGITGGNYADDFLGMDPNGGGAVPVGNAVAPLVAAYFMGGLSGLGDAGSIAANAGSYAADTEGIMAALAAQGVDAAAMEAALLDAGIGTTAEAAAFGGALDASSWASFLSPVDYSLTAGSSAGSGLGMTGSLAADGLGFAGTEAAGLAGGLAADGLGFAGLEGLAGMGGGTGLTWGGIGGTGASLGNSLLSASTLSNLGKAYKAFTNSKGANGQPNSPNSVQGFMNSLQTMALMAEAMKGKNGIDPTSLQTHDRVAPIGPDFSKATQNRMARKLAQGGQVKGPLERVSSPKSKKPQHRVAGGQDDVVPIHAAPGEYMVDADVVAALGDGNTEAGARKLDQMRYNIRSHKRSAPANEIPPKALDPHHYLGK